MKTMIEQFRDFTASKPPAETYDWMDGRACALAQFLKAQGIEFRAAGLNRYVDKERHIRPLWDAEYGACICCEPHTFGALTERMNATLTRATGDA